MVAPHRRVRREQPSAHSRKPDQPGAATRNLDFQAALAEVVIALLQRAEHLLVGVPAITVLADRAFPSADLLRWLEVRRHHGR